jgi:glycosyltransferase involved in cell wall biosynthesis
VRRKQEGERVRVLIFTQQLAAFRSGVGTYAAGLVSGLRELGHDLTVIVPPHQCIEVPGATVVGARHLAWDPTPGSWLSLGAAFARELERRQAQFDVAHFTDAREAWRIRNPACPVTGMVNDAYALEWSRPGYPRRLYADRRLRHAYYLIQRKLEKAAYRKLSGLMANSRHVAEQIIGGYGLPRASVRTVYYGLKPPGIIRARKLEGSPALLFIGGNFQRKGLPVLIEAVAALKPRHPGIRLHVAGKDRNQPALAGMAARLGVGEHVTFHGWKPNEEARAMLAGADMFALPSLTEGFGFVYLEAMQLGTPVIATNKGGAREVFRENREVVFVDHHNGSELAEAIARISSDKTFADSLREGGRLAAARFTPREMAIPTADVWSSLLSQRHQQERPCGCL